MSPPIANTDVSQRATEMRAVISKLDSMQTEAVLAFRTSGMKEAMFGPLALILEYIRDKSGLNNSVDTGLKITKRAIDELAGRLSTDQFGNLFDRAVTDDTAFKFWCQYAQQTGETLAMSLEYTSFSITTFLKNSLANLKDAKDEIKDELAAPSAIIVTILILVVVILLIK